MALRKSLRAYDSFITPYRKKYLFFLNSSNLRESPDWRAR